MKDLRFTILALLALPATAHASSDAAWRAFDAKVATRCIAESGLTRATTSDIVGFDDTLGKVVTLVSGTERLHGGRSIATGKLCVFDQRTGRTWLSEVSGWHAPARRPR